MKVCMCSFTGYNQLNGSNLRAYFLAKEFLKRGYDLEFIVPNENDAESCKARFNAKAYSVGLDIHRFKKSRLKLYPVFAFRARKHLRDYDLVFGQSIPSALAVRTSKTRAKKTIDYVDLWSEYWLYANPNIKGKIIYNMIKKAEGFSTKVDLVFTITQRLKQMLVQRGCREEKIRIVRDGVDLKMFYPMHPPRSFFEKYNLEKERDYLVYQGGIAAHDGVQFLVDAAPPVLEKNPNVRFLIVGTGSYLDVIKKKVAELNLEKNFIFTGWVDYEDMPFFMNLARLNIVPLPDAPATNGVVTYKLMEGIACGTPTVIADLPGVRGAVEHKKTAYLARSEDRTAISSAINELIENKELYESIKQNGFKMIKSHDWRDIAKEMVDVMEK